MIVEQLCLLVVWQRLIRNHEPLVRIVSFLVAQIAVPARFVYNDADVHLNFGEGASRTSAASSRVGSRKTSTASASGSR